MFVAVPSACMRKPKERGGAIPLPDDHWWPPYAFAAIEERARRAKRKQLGWRELAAELVAAGVTHADDDKVRRCVTRNENGVYIVTWEIAIPLSRLLGILPPAFIADTRETAEAIDDPEVLDEARRAIRKARKLALRIAAETRQTQAAESSHEQQRQPEQRRPLEPTDD